MAAKPADKSGRAATLIPYARSILQAMKENGYRGTVWDDVLNEYEKATAPLPETQPREGDDHPGPIAPLKGDTPRTDARWNELYDQGGNTITWFEVAERVRDFARQLERKLASKTRDADHFFQLSGRYLEELNAVQSATPQITNVKPPCGYCEDPQACFDENKCWRDCQPLYTVSTSGRSE